MAQNLDIVLNLRDNATAALKNFNASFGMTAGQMQSAGRSLMMYGGMVTGALGAVTALALKQGALKDETQNLNIAYERFSGTLSQSLAPAKENGLRLATGFMEGLNRLPAPLVQTGVQAVALSGAFMLLSGGLLNTIGLFQKLIPLLLSPIGLMVAMATALVGLSLGMGNLAVGINRVVQGEMSLSDWFIHGRNTAYDHAHAIKQYTIENAKAELQALKTALAIAEETAKTKLASEAINGMAGAMRFLSGAYVEFEGNRWSLLAAAGANVQHPDWNIFGPGMGNVQGIITPPLPPGRYGMPEPGPAPVIPPIEDELGRTSPQASVVIQLDGETIARRVFQIGGRDYLARGQML